MTWQPLERGTVTSTFEDVLAAAGPEYPVEEVRRVWEEQRQNEVWLNDQYQVVVSRHVNIALGEFTHLSIRRIDREPARDWRDLQRIKSELVGPECEGVELFPAESRLLDVSNQTHLWVLNDPGQRIPLGWFDERTVSGASHGKMKQRRLEG